MDGSDIFEEHIDALLCKCIVNKSRNALKHVVNSVLFHIFNKLSQNDFNFL